MAEYGLPVLFALVVWWFSTGLIIYLDGLPRRTFGWSLAGGVAVLAVSLHGLGTVATDTSVTGAYLGFTYGLLVWGCLELTFYLGYVTGPRRQACASGCRGWPHFVHACQTILYHEALTAAVTAMVVWLCWNAPNQTGLWTILILWGMQLSAKFNVFLGVRNLNEEFLPEHLFFLRSFLRKRQMNPFFPPSVTVATVIALALTERAVTAVPGTHEATAMTLLATITWLAVLEHWFLVLPLPVAALWSWGLRSHAAESWSAPLADHVDAGRLQALLDDVAQGKFGEVETVIGVARVGSGWVRFDVTEGRPRVVTLLPDEGAQAQVTATGSRVDGSGLRAAFEACVVTGMRRA